MTNSFRIDASELQGWHDALAKRLDLRGVPAIAKEVEAHLARKDSEGTVTVSRHQLFTWAEALAGAAAREPSGGIAPVVAEMRAILAGKAAAPPAAETRVARTSTAGILGGIAPGQEIAAYEPRTAPAPVPAVTYSAPASRGVAGVVLTGAQLGDAVRDLIRSASRELYVSSPWATGMETIALDVAAAREGARVLVLSRRPERDDGAFHQTMDKLGRRRVVTAWSPYIQTRMVISDERAIVGAASIPAANSREVGVLVTDAATVSALRAAFERAHTEAAGGKY